jgi:tetratricopeptide (TPR) repeat protein
MIHPERCRQEPLVKAEAGCPKGLDLVRQGKFEEAVNAFRREVEADQKNPNSLFNLASALRVVGRRAEAIQPFEEALRLKPHWPMALYSLGSTLLEMGDLQRSLTLFRESVALQPDWSAACEGLGRTLHQQGDLLTAKSLLERALSLDPDLHTAVHSLGDLYLDLDDVEAALFTYRKAVLGASSSCPQCHLALSLLLLLRGEYSEAWKEYEWRWAAMGQEFQRPDPCRPQWDGSPLEGKTIVLCAEQGLGDILHFVRFATLLHDRGATVWLFCPPYTRPLTRLLATCPGVSRVVSEAGDLDDFDYQIPLGSLPAVLGITLDNLNTTVPYLIPPSGPWAADPFGPRRGDELRVGVVWGVDPGHPNWQERSCPVSAFRPLESVPGVELYGLQFGPRAAELLLPDSPRMADLSAVLGDFANTAALLQHLDLVVTVDTSMAHLAGAIGKPVWTLLPRRSDWRWLLERGDTPWYPSMRLFRQREPGRWEPVIERVVAALRELRQEESPQ